MVIGQKKEFQMRRVFYNPIVLCITWSTMVLTFLSSSLSSQPAVSGHNIIKEIADNEMAKFRKMSSAKYMMTPNQEKYDVKFYALNLEPDPIKNTLKGNVIIECEVVSNELDILDLNFWDGMSVSKVFLSILPDQELHFEHSSDVLRVSLGSAYKNGDYISLEVHYQGSPQFSEYESFFFHEHNGQRLIWTLSEPYGARAWWPCKDMPLDKADSADISVTVPNKYIVASNGNLIEKTTQGNKTTYLWHEQYPIPTYLISIAIYPYEVYYEDYLYNDNADTMKIHFYMFPDHVKIFREANSRTKEMIKVFAELFGEYPFVEEKYGHAEITPGVVGGMEHQTCTSLNFASYINNPDRIDWLVSHELAHQWWGDLITCDDFHHIWLNEGFATYSSAFWYEHLYGEGAASDYMMSQGKYLGPGTVYVEHPENFGTIFVYQLTYLKAAWVLHMLRHTVTDPVFFEILKTYAASPLHAYGTATTAEFREICEEISGMNLSKFFQQWIYSEYYPYYSYGWSIKEELDSYRIKVRIDQVQQEKIRENLGLFWMPIDVTINMANSDTTFVVLDSLKSQTFEFTVKDKPVMVELDPDNWILTQVEQGEVLPYPYAENMSLRNTFDIQESGTLQVVTGTANPDQEDLKIEAIVESIDDLFRDSFLLYDDGNHGDGKPDDGVFGGSWSMPTVERRYTIKTKVISLTSGFSSISGVQAGFTTIGPIVLDRFEALVDTVPNPGDNIYYKISLRNDGSDRAVEQLSVELVSLDSLGSVKPEGHIGFDDIAPGEVSEPHLYILSFDEYLPSNPYTVNFLVDILSGEQSYWQDTLSIMVHENETALEREIAGIPSLYALHQNYPNPFNPTTEIAFDLPGAQFVVIELFNNAGQKLETLLKANRSAGSHRITFNGSQLPSGIYYYKIKAGLFEQVRKMVLIQ
jgi:hypothetical protein